MQFSYKYLFSKFFLKGNIEISGKTTNEIHPDIKFSQLINFIFHFEISGRFTNDEH